LPGLVREILSEGFITSAVSRGELSLAERAGASPERIVLEGIGKTDADLRAAARNPPLWVSLETLEDAAALSRAAQRARTRVEVVVRVNPAVAPETHRGLAVGASESKFGILAQELPAVIAAGGGVDGALIWRGIHMHVGSQLGAIDAWRSAFRIGLRMLGLQRATLPHFDTLDAGGGFPVAMTDEPASAVPTPAHFAQAAAAELALVPADARPARLAVEPGRSVVAASGWLVGRVLHVRDRDPLIVVLDTGMTELVRSAMYGALHPMFALTSLGRATEATTAEMTRVRVDGPICESTDTFGSADLPSLTRGDLVAIGIAGAYGSSMASTYNGRPRPAEIAWDGELLTVMRKRESVSSLP
jgi:diaminopimelate decarboxylase